jgi:hypothetical protein
MVHTLISNMLDHRREFGAFRDVVPLKGSFPEELVDSLPCSRRWTRQQTAVVRNFFHTRGYLVGLRQLGRDLAIHPDKRLGQTEGDSCAFRLVIDIENDKIGHGQYRSNHGCLGAFLVDIGLVDANRVDPEKREGYRVPDTDGSKGRGQVRGDRYETVVASYCGIGVVRIPRVGVAGIPQAVEHIELRGAGPTRWAWHVDDTHSAAQVGDGRMQLKKTKLARPKGAVMIIMYRGASHCFVGRLGTVGRKGRR